MFLSVWLAFGYCDTNGQGRQHKERNVCEMHHGENWGGGICDNNDAFTRVCNNLLLHEYIYYFTPVHF